MELIVTTCDTVNSVTWQYYQNIVMCPTKLKDNCDAIYNGASGGMGFAGMKKNFHRFLLWYVNFLCLDLKAFSVGHL
jgi:hypothetical protein